MTALIYGRTEYAEPLTEVGSLDQDLDPVEVFPGKWVEMISFPETSIHWIVRDGEAVVK